MYDVTNTSVEIENSGVEIAILPIGAIEQHGPHLPLSVDWFQGEAVSKGVATKLNAFLLPGIPYSNSQAHDGFRGSISLSPETLATVVQEICLELLDQGFRRIGVLNFHGGNLVLKIAIRDLNLNNNIGKIVLVHPHLETSESLGLILDDLECEQHAGELETSVMMHLAPDQVGLERIDHVPNVTPTYFDYIRMKEFCPDGIWGKPSLATAEKGGRAVKSMIETTASCLETTFADLDTIS